MTNENIDIASLMKKIECAELTKLKQLFPDLDFTKELTEKPEHADYLRKQIAQEAMKATDPLLKPNAPKLNDDFSNYFVINNLPKCSSEKLPKLESLIRKTLEKQNLKIEEDALDIPLDPATSQTYGVAFVRMNNEENARIGAKIFDNFKLTKNNIFATCLLPDFEKVMQTAEDLSISQPAADLKDLRAPILDTKREQFFYKSGKNVIVNYFDSRLAMTREQPQEQLICLENISDKKVQWSPKGTYLIVIKPEQVVFLGGAKMLPIITLPISKVDHVSMSPCERYVLAFSPMADVAFSVWNFQLVELIRELPIAEDEDADTYQWSHDGQFLAKKFVTKITKETTGETKTKEGLSVFELPSMQMVTNSEGQKKSITLMGIRDWMWCKNRNMIVYTRFFESEEGEEEKTKQSEVDPQVGFMTIPQRVNISVVSLKNAMNLRFTMHPQGDYLAVVNEYRAKKSTKYAVELFDLKKGDIVPHQQIFIKREIIEFFGVHWQPRQPLLAIHTKSPREEAGLTIGAERLGIDVYKMQQDDIRGFLVQPIGAHPSEKVIDFSWSPAEDVFAICERDGGGFNAKTSWNFFMIQEIEPEIVQNNIAKPLIRGKGGKQLALSTSNQLQSEQARFEFRKTARQEAIDQKTAGVWDEFGRFLVIHGVKKPGPIDKERRHIRIYSIFGKPLFQIELIPQLTQFAWRPRPKDILPKKEAKALKKDFRKKYGKIHKEEEQKERAVLLEQERVKKHHIRTEFLENFWLAQRAKYEEDMDKYEAMWPLKEKDYAEQNNGQATLTHVYNYGDLVETKKLTNFW